MNILSVVTLRDVFYFDSALWQLDDYYDRTVADRETRILSLSSSASLKFTVSTLSDGTECVEMSYKYDRYFTC